MDEYVGKKDVNAVLRECVRVYPSSFYQGIEAARIAVIKLPAADVRPVARGEWLEPDDDYGYLICSVCEERSPNDERWRFCPNCGADMRGENDDD